MIPGKFVVHPSRIIFQNDFPNAHTAVCGVYEDSFDISGIIVDGGKERGILIQNIAEQTGVAVACGFPGEILDWVEGWMRGSVV